jgi:hypothetical protein
MKTSLSSQIQNIQLTQIKVEWSDLVNTVMNLRFYKMRDIGLTE